jgi:flagellar protein FliJ
MTFHFPYIQILNLKEKEKEQAYIEFGTIVRKKEVIMVEHQSFEQKRSEFFKQAEVTKGHSSIADIKQQHEYLDYLNQKISKLDEMIIKIDYEIASKKSELLEKQKDEKTWNHLRDKSYEKYVQKQKKIEQDLMDEMAAIRHFHHRLSM